MRSFHNLLLVASLLPASLVFAQTPAPVAAPTGIASSDAILAAWLHNACTNEIALAGIAVKQSKNSDVRAFAQTMVDEHTAFAAKLQPFVGAATPPAKVGEAKKPAPTNDKSPTDASANHAPAVGDSFDHAGLIRELGAKCLATQSKQLTSKPAAEFDRCFVTMLIGAHEKGIDMLTVFRAHASKGLATTLDEGLKVYGAHHTKALSLHKKIADVVVEGRGGR